MLVKTPKHLDRIDRNILVQLQKNGRISNVELAKEVGLSPSPCLERVKRLEAQGYIKGYHAVVDPEKLGAAMLVFVEITLTKTSVDIFAEFSAAVKLHDDIQEVTWCPEILTSFLKHALQIWEAIGCLLYTSPSPRD